MARGLFFFGSCSPFLKKVEKIEIQQQGGNWWAGGGLVDDNIVALITKDKVDE